MRHNQVLTEEHYAGMSNIVDQCAILAQECARLEAQRIPYAMAPARADMFPTMAMVMGLEQRVLAEGMPPGLVQSARTWLADGQVSPELRQAFGLTLQDGSQPESAMVRFLTHVLVRLNRLADRTPGAPFSYSDSQALDVEAFHAIQRLASSWQPVPGGPRDLLAWWRWAVASSSRLLPDLTTFLLSYNAMLQGGEAGERQRATMEQLSVELQALRQQLNLDRTALQARVDALHQRMGQPQQHSLETMRAQQQEMDAIQQESNRIQHQMNTYEEKSQTLLNMMQGV